MGDIILILKLYIQFNIRLKNLRSCICIQRKNSDRASINYFFNYGLIRTIHNSNSILRLQQVEIHFLGKVLKSLFRFFHKGYHQLIRLIKYWYHS